MALSWGVRKSCWIPKIDHKERVVILWKRKNDENAAKILVTHRIKWEVRRIQGVYKERWSGTETFHGDGKRVSAKKWAKSNKTYVSCHLRA